MQYCNQMTSYPTDCEIELACLRMRGSTKQLAENLKPWKMAMEGPISSVPEDVCGIIIRSIKEKQKVCCVTPERGRG